MGEAVLEIVHREGLARVCRWQADAGELRTPSLIVPETSAGVPDWAEVTLGAGPDAGAGVRFVSEGTWFYPRDVSGAELVVPAVCPSPTSDVQVLPIGDDVAVWHDAGGWATHSGRTVTALTKARREATPARLLWAPALGTPADYAVWASLGVDLFDASPLLLAATRGEAWTADGVLVGAAVTEVLGLDPEDVEALTRFNLEAARDELRRVRHAISSGSLRSLAERRAYTAPGGIELLRRFDRHFEHFDMAVPRLGGPVDCMTPEALWRPDVEAFRRRVRDDYAPPPADVLVLLPCSARKPYGRSKSHRYFARTLDDSGIRHRVHEVMITSPLGVVPRELENAWPAASYDVPVTGRWMLDEEEVIREQLAALLDAGHYQHVVAHVPASTWSFIRDLLPDGAHHSNVAGAPQSIAGCRDLAAALARVKEDVGRSDGFAGAKARKLDDLRALASFQFGPEAGAALVADASARGKAPFVKLFGPDGSQRGMVTDRGLLSLTLEGAELVAACGVKRVHIGDFWPSKTSTLFAVGVDDCDDDVRIGDTVVVVHNGEVRACGIATMSAEEMRVFKRGAAVNLKHVVKAPAPVQEVVA